MRYLTDEKPPLDELAHFGVKGMKWGVRKAYADRNSAKLNRLSRVASGNASGVDKVRTTLGSSIPELIRGRGLKGAARIQRDSLQAHLDRVKQGKATTGDVLKMVGDVRIADLFARGD